MITSRDLRSLRLHNGVAERQVARGSWRRAARGIYLTHMGAPAAAELVAAARACAGARFVVTGLFVLRELELPWVPAVDEIHVLVPPEVRRAGGDLVRITRASDFDVIDTWVRHAARMAPAERAVVDGARSLSSLRDVRGVVLGAVSGRWATVDDLRQVLDSGRRNGSALTRRAIDDAARGCASPPEAELVDALVGRRVPFYANPELWLGGRLIGSPDVWLVGRGVGGEVDSQERHGTDRQVENTYDRHERFGAAGLELVHLSVRRIRRDPGEAAARLLSEPARPEPAGLVIVPRGPLLT